LASRGTRTPSGPVSPPEREEYGVAGRGELLATSPPGEEIDFYGRSVESSVPVLQLSYDDVEGRFPWEDGYAAPDMQPRPGTFTA